MKIALEERFTDMQLFDMFNVELRSHKDGTRVDRVDETSLPLWKRMKRTLKRGEKKAVQTTDFIREGVSIHPPGSDERMADLVAWYEQRQGENGPQGEVTYQENALSAFTI